MNQLEAHLTAKTLAAQLLDDHMDAEKLQFLQQIVADLALWLKDEANQQDRAA